MSRSNKSGGAPSKKYQIETQLTHLGRDPEAHHGMINMPLYRGSTILYPSLEALTGRTIKYTYGRRGTPTISALEDSITELEGGAHTVLTCSGLSACAIAVLTNVKSGGHLLMTDSAYQPVRKICDRFLTQFGVETTFYDPQIGQDIAGLIRKETQLIYTESPGSQTFEVQDLPAIIRVANDKGIPVATDNTWASPLYFNPLSHGADFVIHAGTKYFCGHSDANLGSVTTTEKYSRQLRQTHGDLGQCPGPEDVQLCLRGMRTLAIRLEHHQKAALEMAEWLSQRDEVARVLHPAREDHPGHEFWKRDFTGSTGLFSIVLKDFTRDALAAMVDHLDLFGMGASWGGYESLIMPFDPTSYRTATEWKAEGPAIRFYIGLENIEDLKADLEAGFERLKSA